MPSKSIHVDTAEANANFAHSLDLSLDVNRGWGATALFYSALHFVEAYFSTLTPSVHSPDHRTRDSSLGRNPVTKQVYSEYQELKNISTRARYYGEYPTEQEFRADVMESHEAIRDEMQLRYH